jgi:hypothetical protein
MGLSLLYTTSTSALSLLYTTSTPAHTHAHHRSFGLVLLEMVTGRHILQPFAKKREVQGVLSSKKAGCKYRRASSLTSDKAEC